MAALQLVTSIRETNIWFGDLQEQIGSIKSQYDAISSQLGSWQNRQWQPCNTNIPTQSSQNHKLQTPPLTANYSLLLRRNAKVVQNEADSNTQDNNKYSFHITSQTQNNNC